MSFVRSFLLNITRNPALPLRIRKKIGKALPIPTNQSFESPVFEAVYFGETGIHMNDKIYLYGLHESSTIRLLRSILKHQIDKGVKPIYLDIGTNTGFHLLACAPLAQRVYGFEPYDPVRKVAEYNIERNQYDHVKIFDFGLSDENEVCTFYSPATNNLGTGSFLPEDSDNSTNLDNTLRLSVQRGDDVLGAENIVPSLIKIDIEGYEEKAFRGLSQTIKTHKPVIIFEYSDQSRASLGNFDMLNSLFGEAYRFFGILRSREKPKLVPFEPHKKYENILAWPNDTDPRQVL